MRKKFLAIFFLAMIAGSASADTTSQAAKVQALFTPGDNIAGAIVAAIRDAKKTINVQCYSFTNKAIGHALLEAHRRHIEISVLADREQFEHGAAFIVRDLKQAGIQVKLDGTHGAAHNKIILIDADGANPKIVTGSFNFTQAAQKFNAENVVMIYNDKNLAQAFRDNWQQHWQHGIAFE